jgi:hypothetical protein
MLLNTLSAAGPQRRRINRQSTSLPPHLRPMQHPAGRNPESANWF